VKRGFLTMLIIPLLASCDGMTVRSQSSQSVYELFDKQKDQTLKNIEKNKTNIPAKHVQLKKAAYLSVFYCAKRRLQPILDIPAGHVDHQKVVMKKLKVAETECAEELVSNILLYQNEDRALEVSLLLHSIDPFYIKQMPLPSYISVD